MMFPKTAVASLLLAACFLFCGTVADAQFGGMVVGRAKVSAVLNVDALRPGQQAVIAVVTDIPQGFHAVSSVKTESNAPFEVAVETSPSLKIFAPIYPAGHDEKYPEPIGTLNIYTGRVVTYVPLQVPDGASTGPLTISGTAGVQMCNDRVCFPPANVPFEIKTQIVALGAAPTILPADAGKRAELFKDFDPGVFSTILSSGTTNPNADGGKLSGSIPSAFSFVGSILTALLAGLILNVMPCVLPVLPLKAMGFYQSAGHSRGRSLLFGSVFATGMVAAFAVLAVLVVVFKQSWGELFSYAWFTWALVAILAVFGLVQITGRSLPLPAGLYNVTFAHDTIGGNFNFGVFTAILSTPCTGPLFPPLLGVAARLPVGFAVTIIMAVGVGMSLPYLVLSGFPELARRFPRTGPWAEIVKQVLGWMLIAVAVYFAAQRFGLGEKFWWPVFATVAATAIFLVVRTVMLMPRARPIVIASVIAFLMTGSALAVTLRLTATSEIWTAYGDEAFSKARAADDVVLVKFTANWCANCNYIEATVFHDPATLKALRAKGVRLVKADLTRRDAPGWPLLKSLSASGGIPLTAVYLRGKPEPVATIESIYTSQTLLESIDSARAATPSR